MTEFWSFDTNYSLPLGPVHLKNEKFFIFGLNTTKRPEKTPEKRVKTKTTAQSNGKRTKKVGRHLKEHQAGTDCKKKYLYSYIQVAIPIQGFGRGCIGDLQ